MFECLQVIYLTFVRITSLFERVPFSNLIALARRDLHLYESICITRFVAFFNSFFDSPLIHSRLRAPGRSLYSDVKILLFFVSRIRTRVLDWVPAGNSTAFRFPGSENVSMCWALRYRTPRGPRATVSTTSI